MEYFDQLTAFLLKLPAMNGRPFTGQTADGLWWMKFSLDIAHSLAWRVVQELAFVVNNLSIDERLPAKFYPTSPPPYLNGGPDEHLYWVIESTDPDFTPTDLFQWLEGRLPNPVDDMNEWEME